MGEGYAADHLARLMEQEGISRYLVSVGGALVSRGMNGEGKPWRVAIQKPTDRENAVQAIVDINGHGISTSGSYRNYYELDGKRISHVIDPQTGQPITHKLVSVTVIAPTALEADGWDTGLMVLGPEKAQQVVREEGLAVYMIVKEGEGFQNLDVAAVPHFPCRREKLKKARLRVFYCGLYHRLRVHLQLETRHETDSCRYR